MCGQDKYVNVLTENELKNIAILKLDFTGMTVLKPLCQHSGLPPQYSLFLLFYISLHFFLSTKTTINRYLQKAPPIGGAFCM